MDTQKPKKSVKKFLLAVLGGIGIMFALLVVIGMFAPKSKTDPIIIKARQALKAGPWVGMEVAQSGVNWAASAKVDGINCSLSITDLSTGGKPYISIDVSVYASQTNADQGMMQVSNAAAVLSTMYPEEADNINKALTSAPGLLKMSLEKAIPSAAIPNADSFEQPFGTIVLTGGVGYPFGDRAQPYDYHLSFYKNIK